MHLSTDLNEWLHYIEAIHPREIDLGLDRLKLVSQALLTESPPQVFTVAGTNGKGTTSAAIAALCQKAGQRVGLYTSPHLFRFNERINIDQLPVQDDELVRAFEAVEAARGDISLSYFEYTTLAALWLFEQAQLDVWVLEVGLGGRLDAVNVIPPDIAIITNVGLDHQGFLGDSIEAIGREKAGICRAGKPVVFGSEDLPASVTDVANQSQAHIYDFGHRHGCSEHRLYWEGGEMALPVPGLPAANAAAALQAFALSPWTLTSQQCAEVLTALHVVGRMQSFTVNGRSIIVDVGHNPHAGAYIAGRLRPEKRHILLGMLSDKDPAGFAAALAPVALTFSTVRLSVSRGLTASELSDRLQQPVWQQVDQIGQYLDLLERDHPGEPLFIGGSFYTVCAAIEYLEQ